MPHHLIPMPRLPDVSFAVNASSNVLGPFVLLETVVTPVRSLLNSGIKELTRGGRVRILAQITKLIDRLIHISWPWMFLFHVVERVFWIYCITRIRMNQVQISTILVAPVRREELQNALVSEISRIESVLIKAVDERIS